MNQTDDWRITVQTRHEAKLLGRLGWVVNRLLEKAHIRVSVIPVSTTNLPFAIAKVLPPCCVWVRESSAKLRPTAQIEQQPRS